LSAQIFLTVTQQQQQAAASSSSSKQQQHHHDLPQIAHPIVIDVGDSAH